MTTSTPAAPVTPAEACAVLGALQRLEITSMTAAYLEAHVPGRDGGSAYRVRVGPGPRGACSCPRAVYAGRRSPECKHTAALRLVAGALPAPLRGDWA